jgi:hypothetical protein
MPVPQKPWTIIAMDFLIALPLSDTDYGKFNSIFVIVDTFSKMCHLLPTVKTVKGPQVARTYFDQIYRLHGLPRSIISDCHERVGAWVREFRAF